jgi:hypothetical protein
MLFLVLGNVTLSLTSKQSCSELILTQCLICYILCIFFYARMQLYCIPSNDIICLDFVELKVNSSVHLHAKRSRYM